MDDNPDAPLSSTTLGDPTHGGTVTESSISETGRVTLYAGGGLNPLGSGTPGHDAARPIPAAPIFARDVEPSLDRQGAHPAVSPDFPRAAMEAFKRRDWQVALSLLDLCLKDFPETRIVPTWRNARAGSLMELGRHAEAENAYEALVEDFPKFAPACIGFARAAQIRRDWPAAVERWDVCLRKFPAHPAICGWRYSLATALVELRRADEAEEAYRLLTQDFPDFAPAFNGLARVAQIRHDWPEAIARWDACLRKFPGHPAGFSWRNSLAAMLLELGRYDQAEEIYRILATERPDVPAGFVGLARLAQRQEMWAQALEHWDTCLSRFAQDPAGSDWRNLRAVVLRELGRHDEAEEAYRALMMETPGDTAGLVGLARVAQRQKKWALAVERWAACVDRFPRNPDMEEWRLSLAGCLKELGHYDEAEAIYRQFATERPGMPAGFTGLARVAQRRAMWGQAIEWWDACLSRFSQHPDADGWRAARAAALIELRLYDEAEAIYRRLVMERPDLPLGLVGLARVAHRKETWPQAIDYWDACLGRFAQDAEADLWRGSRAMALLELGRDEEAEEVYRALVVERPDVPIGFAGLARVAQRQEKWVLAIGRWDACLNRFGHDPDVYLWRAGHGTILIELERYAEAAQVFRALVTERPDVPAGFVGLARLAQRQEMWPQALEHWDTCLSRFAQDPASSDWRDLRAAVLRELGRYDEAEEACRALMMETPDDPAGFVGLARVAQRQGMWALAVERWAACVDRFPRDPDLEDWRAARAMALENQEAWPEAYAAWEAMIRDGMTARSELAHRADCLLEWQGPTDEAAQLASVAVEADPDDFWALRIRARVEAFRGDHKAELFWRFRGIEAFPDELEAYRLAMSAVLKMADQRGADRIIAMAPVELAGTVGFRCRILLNYHRLQGNVGAGFRIIEGIDEAELDEPSAVAVATFLHHTVQTERLLTFTERMLERFPENLGFIAQHLSSLCRLHGHSAFERKKAQLLAAFSEPDAAEVLQRLPISWLTDLDVRQVIDVSLAQEGESVGNWFFLLGARHDKELLSYVAERLESHRDNIGRFIGRSLAAIAQDMHRIASANFGGVSWDDFRAASQSLADNFARLLSQSAGPDAVPQPVIEATAKLRQLAVQFSAAWVHSAESYYDAASFAAWLTARVRRGEPTSVLRLGDGEGNFLPYKPQCREFQEADRYLVQQLWWGGEQIAPRAARLVSDGLVQAVQRSDAVGVPPPRRLIGDLRGSETSHGVRGILNCLDIVEGLSPESLPGKVLISCHIHWDLAQWGLYRQIFAAVSSVSVISSHDLSRPLAGRFGLAVRCWFRTPTEHYTAGMFADPDQAAFQPFYPAIFERIMASVAPLPGELFLVAAGMLGKLLCDRIRERGGIAFDIGSIADLWMGRATRFETPAELDFDVASSLIAGQPFLDNFDPANIAQAAPCRSDGSRRFNLTGRFDDLFGADETAPAPRRYSLRVIGHPRCGSAHVAQVLNRLGLAIGHEAPGEQGLCGWSHAVDDLDPPMGAPHIPAAAFDATIAYVRDPNAAIPSIMQENWGDESFSFRRFHIARLLGVDIARRRDPLERAVESYLLWMKIVEQQRPIFTLRVEHLGEDLPAHRDELAALGLDLQWNEVAALPDGPDEAPHKFSLPPPEIAPARYRAIAADLADALSLFCERHGYRLPWTDAPSEPAKSAGRVKKRSSGRRPPAATELWRELHGELALWAASGERVTLWWRDDDAVEDNKSVRQLLDFAEFCPLSLAVIPAGATKGLAKLVATLPNVAILQHGWAHKNYANSAKESEYPGHRPMKEVQAEFVKGKSRLSQLFGNRALPVFVPPFHDFDDKFLSPLAEAGLKAISRGGRRQRRAAMQGLAEVNTQIELHDWHAGRFYGEDVALTGLLRHLRRRRLNRPDREEPIGILSHHFAEDEPAWAFMTGLLSETRSYPNVQWLSGEEVFSVRPASSNEPH